MDTKYVESIMKGMNTSIPVTKRTLIDYAEGDDLSYRTRTGETIQIERSEIELLMDVCTESEKIRLKLPILLSTDTSGEGTAWKVDGTVESKVIARLLDKPQFRDDSVKLYNPDYKNLRKMLPNAVVTVFIP